MRLEGVCVEGSKSDDMEGEREARCVMAHAGRRHGSGGTRSHPP